MSAVGSDSLSPATAGWSALAGLQAGIVAGVAALGWFMGVSALAGRGAWETPLSLAAAFYRSSALPYWSWRSFLAGSAVYLVASGLTGACYGLLASRINARRRSVLFGILAGLLMYYGWHVLLRLPERHDFFDGAGALSGHLLFGALLGSMHGPFRRSLLRELRTVDSAAHSGAKENSSL
ncbi:MAG: hypothetical protein K6T61_01700 [Bryobacteraceae bacterium]|nr:hypothetical protein [Bryobacteraceae bacterium]